MSAIKIISGGQTGADTAALRAARRAGVETGGWIPAAWSDLERLRDFPMMPYNAPTLTASLIGRSKKNVDDADATIAFYTHFSVGTHKTINYALGNGWSGGAFPEMPVPREILDMATAYEIPSKRKPVLLVRNIGNMSLLVYSIVNFIQRHRPAVVNVCGHREDVNCENFETIVEEAVYQALMKRDDDVSGMVGHMHVDLDD